MNLRETRAVVRLKHSRRTELHVSRRLHSPDHPLKQVMDDEVRLSHHDQQSHVGPAELEKGGKHPSLCLFTL